jgi:threonine/homoserine/homoserine lactone efflux protein
VLTAWLIGMLMGMAGSIPVAGPATALVVGLGLERRMRTAVLVGLGSSIPEGAWACLALWGFAALVERHAWIEPVAQSISVLLLLAIGGLLIARAGHPAVLTSGESRPETGTVRSLLFGLSLTGLNPTLIVNWAAAIALVYSLGLLEPAPELAIPFGLGVSMGIVTWFAIVLRLLHQHHGRISARGRTITMRVIGALLVVLGLVAGGRALLGGGGA